MWCCSRGAAPWWPAHAGSCESGARTTRRRRRAVAGYRGGERCSPSSRGRERRLWTKMTWENGLSEACLFSSERDCSTKREGIFFSRCSRGSVKVGVQPSLGEISNFVETVYDLVQRSCTKNPGARNRPCLRVRGRGRLPASMETMGGASIRVGIGVRREAWRHEGSNLQWRYGVDRCWMTTPPARTTVDARLVGKRLLLFS